MKWANKVDPVKKRESLKEINKMTICKPERLVYPTSNHEPDRKYGGEKTWTPEPSFDQVTYLSQLISSLPDQTNALEMLLTQYLTGIAYLPDSELESVYEEYDICIKIIREAVQQEFISRNIQAL